MDERVIRNQNARCTHCGLCKNACPVFRILKEEQFSPRGKNLIFNAFSQGEYLEEGAFFFKYCNGCEACVQACPLKLGFDVIKARMVALSQETNTTIAKEQQEMVERIEKDRNPFGKIDSEGGIPDKLYCC